MKKYKLLITLFIMILILTGCAKNTVILEEANIELSDRTELSKDTVSKETTIIETFDETESYENSDEIRILVKHYKLSDGTYTTDDGYIYKYKLEITGRMGGAVKDSTFVYLSNISDISFKRAFMAAGFSSNMDDYFKAEEAKFVGLG